MCVGGALRRARVISLSFSPCARARVCVCACVCLSASRSFKTLPTALQRSAEKNEANWRKLLYTKRESAHKRVFFFHTFVRSLSTHSAVARRHARAWGKEKRDTSTPPPRLVAGTRGQTKIQNWKSSLRKSAHSLSLSLSLSVERCPCPRTRRPDESRGRSPSSPRLDCSLDRRF